MRLLALGALGSVLVATASNADVIVPPPAYLFWPGGPPNLLPSGGRGDTFAPLDSHQRILAVATSSYRLDIDVHTLRIRRLDPGPLDETVTLPIPDRTGDDRWGRLAWSTEAGWRQAIRFPGTATGPEYFPVRIMESGPVFQHAAVHGLGVEGVSGSFWLEVLAWPDRLRILLRSEDLDTVDQLRAWGDPQLHGLGDWHRLGSLPVKTIEGRAVETFAGWEWHCPHAPTLMGSLLCPESDVAGESASLDPAIRVVLPSLPGAEDTVTSLGSPLSLGRSAKYAVTLKNPSSKSARLDVVVELPKNVSMTGHSLLLLDADGHSTGIPIQISKNWHRKQLDAFLPYMGTWSHGRFSVTLPPGFDENFTLVLVQGDYGPYHAASLAQLSLIGWGGNGFWIQGALGSWGETVCLQPGRVLRRTYMTDWRPFMSEGINGKQYNWSANAGGADLFVLFDEEGRYVPFFGNRHLVRGYGPCLAEMAFEETTRDGHLAVKGTWFLPQSRDVARMYLQVRIEVREDRPFSRFSLFQAGADYYDPQRDLAIAVGSGSTLERVVPLPVSRTVEEVAPVAFSLEGPVPWFSFYGEAVDVAQRLGQAQRLVVVHAYAGRLGGREVEHPVMGIGHGGDAKTASYQAELLALPERSLLRKGDFIEMTLELVLLPLEAAAYYGPCELTRSLLEAHANSADMATQMVAGHQPRLEGSRFTSRLGPLPCLDWAEAHGKMTLRGTSALVPLRIREVPHSGTFIISSGQGSVPLQPAQQWRRDGQGQFEAVVMLDPLQIKGPFTLSLASPSTSLRVASNP